MTEDYKVDDLDLAIIEILGNDGRASASEIASQIGDISERTIRNRLTALIERRLVHIGAMADPTTLGSKIHADVLIEVDTARTLEVANRLIAFPNINYVACTTGEYGIAIALSAKTTAELLEFVHGEISRIPGVRRTVVNILLAILKTFGSPTKSADDLQKRITERFENEHG
jgi:Lrp/AsnC family transcriptional regulator for asnA, asnC and gidA